MNRAAFVLAPLLIASAVRAGPVEPSHYAGGSLMFGASEPVDNGYNVMLAGDAGYRLTGLLWARGGLGYGTSIDRFGQHVPNGGRNAVARAGLEARWCAGSILCGLAGADLGVQHGTWNDSAYNEVTFKDIPRSTTETALVAIPRVGVDFGGTSLRMRVALEADTAIVGRATATTAMASSTTSETGLIGIELAAGVAYQW
jgi:hypothetical protein